MFDTVACFNSTPNVGSAGAPAPAVTTAVSSAEIETVAFIDDEPALLFAGGYGTKYVIQLVWSIDEINNFMRVAPSSWFQWRRGASGIEVNRGAGWTPAPEVPAPPAGTEPAGLFWSEKSSAAGGIVFQEHKAYRFTAGTYEQCASEKASGAGLPETKWMKDSGTYTINRYVLHITSTRDGSARDVLVLYQPNTIPRRIWIGGEYPSIWYLEGGPMDKVCKYQ